VEGRPAGDRPVLGQYVTPPHTHTHTPHGRGRGGGGRGAAGGGVPRAPRRADLPPRRAGAAAGPPPRQAARVPRGVLPAGAARRERAQPRVQVRQQHAAQPPRLPRAVPPHVRQARRALGPHLPRLPRAAARALPGLFLTVLRRRAPPPPPPPPSHLPSRTRAPASPTTREREPERVRGCRWRSA